MQAEKPQGKAQNDAQNKTLLTGIKPSGDVHLGNYLGAIRPGLELVSQFENSILFIADYHALTTVQNPRELREYTLQTVAIWLACGLDPKRTIIYRQSDVPEIFELAWVLSCVTPKGLLNRAHAYKAKVQENQAEDREDLDFGVSMGLFNYPVLMAADILLFNTDAVPVGEDQVQHVEIARDIAQKFNRTYKVANADGGRNGGHDGGHDGGEIIHLPQALVKTKKVIPGLDGRKMSKSYGNQIPLFLESKALRKLVMKIKTDSTPPEAPKDTKDSLLFDLYKEFASPAETETLAARYAKGIGWGEVKELLFQAIENHFSSATVRYHELMAKPDELESVLANGARRARELAAPLMAKVRHAIRG